MAQQFDEHSVEAYKGRFALTFDMDEQDGEGVAYNDFVTFLVRARVTKADVSEDRQLGTLVRKNTFSVTDAQLMTEDEINGAAVKAFMENTDLDLADLGMGDGPDEGSTATELDLSL